MTASPFVCGCLARGRLTATGVVFVVLAVAACSDPPASVSFSPPEGLVLQDASGHDLPPVVVKGKSGKILPQTSAPVLTAEPADVVRIDGNHLVPLRNGSTVISATVPGIPPATLDVDVRVVDDLRIMCPAPCTVALGASARVEAIPLGFGVRVERDAEWTSSDPAVATVSKGVVTGVALGTVGISATVGDKSARIEVSVVAPTTQPGAPELRLSCAWPPFVIRTGTPPAALTHSSGCIVEMNQPAEVMLQEQKGDVVRRVTDASWTTTDAGVVAVVRGALTGLKPGTATVEATVGDLTVQMPVTVNGAAARAACGAPESYKTTTRAELQVSRDVGGTVASDYLCESAAASTCVADTNAELKRTVSSLTPDLGVVLAQHTLKEAARRCCCTEQAPKPQTPPQDAPK